MTLVRPRHLCALEPTPGHRFDTLGPFTYSRVNVFMNKFKKLGFIDYNGGLRINDSLLSIVLHD